MSNTERQVDLVTIIAEQFMSGFEPDYGLLIEAEQLGVDVDAIREEVDRLYEPELPDELDFNE